MAATSICSNKAGLFKLECSCKCSLDALREIAQTPRFTTNRLLQFTMPFMIDAAPASYCNVDWGTSACQLGVNLMDPLVPIKPHSQLFIGGSTRVPRLVSRPARRAMAQAWHNGGSSGKDGTGWRWLLGGGGGWGFWILRKWAQHVLSSNGARSIL